MGKREKKKKKFFPTGFGDWVEKSVISVQHSHVSENGVNFNECRSFTKISNTSSTTNAVDIFLNIAGQIKVDDVLYIGDI